jgi:hypothetical protein
MINIATEMKAEIQDVPAVVEKVLNFWGHFGNNGFRDEPTPEFITLYNLARRYEQAKGLADNLREFHNLNSKALLEEQRARSEFVQMYRSLSLGNN